MLRNKMPSLQDARAERREAWLVAGLCLAALLPYLNILANEFVYDDEAQILQNPYVHSWHFVRQIFTTNVWSFMGAAGTTNYYRPLMTSSYLLTWKLLGPLPIAFHIVNLAWHLAAVLLAYFCAKRLFGDLRVAGMAALLFALHPVHTEAVAWAAALPDLQVTVFCLLALLVYSAPGPFTRGRAAGFCVLFALALLSKEPALMLAPLLLIYEFRPQANQTGVAGENRLTRVTLVVTMAVAYIGLRRWLLGALAPVLQHNWVSWREAVLSAFALIAQYTGLLFWPARLSAFHVFVKSTSITEPLVLAGVAIVVADAILVVWLWRRAWPAAFAVLWIGFTLAPVLNARWMASNVLAERYLYLPSVGFCWLVAWAGVAAWDWCARQGLSSRRTVRVCLAAATTALAVLAVTRLVTRNRDWSDDGKLYAQTLRTDPMATVIRSNVATGYFINGRFDLAEQEYLRVLRERPDLAPAANALGVLYAKEGRNREAAAMFSRAIAQKPQWSDPYVGLGNLLLDEGDQAGAERQYGRAIQLSPLNAPALNRLGALLLAQHRDNEAIERLSASVGVQMTAEASLGLAEALRRTGDSPAEEAILVKALAAYPLSSELHFRLADLYAEEKRVPEAIREYRKGLETDPRNTQARSALAQLTPQP